MNDSVLDSMLTDPQMVAKWAAIRAAGSGDGGEPEPFLPCEVSFEQAMKNLQDSQADGSIDIKYATKQEQLRAELEQSTSLEARRRKAELDRMNAEIEAGACAEMWNCWRTSEECNRWRRAVAEASTCLMPGAQHRDEHCRQLREIAKRDLIQSVECCGLGFTAERLEHEAEMFCRNFEKPIDGGNSGYLPRDAGPCPQGMLTTTVAPLKAWCYNDTAARASALEEQRRQAIRQQNMNYAAGSGAVARDR